MTARMNVISPLLIMTPKESHIYNPRLQSGAKNLACIILNIKIIKALFQTITNSKMTPEGSHLYNLQLQSGVPKTLQLIVWRLIIKKIKALFQTLTNSKLTPEGSHIGNPRLKSGVKRNACTIVWRLICALTNKMTNYKLTPLHLTR